VGQALQVQLERPTGRTTWTWRAWSARLCVGGRWRVNRLPTSATRRSWGLVPVHPGARGPRRRHLCLLYCQPGFRALRAERFFIRSGRVQVALPYARDLQAVEVRGDRSYVWW